MNKKERKAYQIERREQNEELRIKLGSHSSEKTAFMMRLKTLQLEEEGKEVTYDELCKIIIPTEPSDCLKAYKEMQRLTANH